MTIRRKLSFLDGLRLTAATAACALSPSLALAEGAQPAAITPAPSAVATPTAEAAHRAPDEMAAPTAVAADQAAAPATQAAPSAPAPATAPKAGQPRVERPNRAGATELTWLGHSAWMLRSPKGTTVLIDPWLTNPRAPQDFVLPQRVDAILVTHGHADHLGEAAALSRRLGAPLIGSFELVEQLGLEHGVGTNPGGMVQVQDLKVHLTQAVHSSSLAWPLAPLPPAAEAAHAGCACNAGAGEKPADTCACHAGGGREPAATCSCHGGSVGVGSQAPDASVLADAGGSGSLLSRQNRAQAPGGKGAKAGDKDVGKAKQGGHHQPRGQSPAEANAPMRPTPAGDDEHPLAHGELPRGAKAPHACAGHHDHDHGQDHEHGHDHGPRFVYAGAALGFVIEVEDGPTLYHAGDTDVFADMRLIARRYRPEIALLPIGGHYTMGPKDAALAARLLGVKEVLPMHYGTFPLLGGTPTALREALGNDARVVSPRPGGKVSFVGHGDG